MQEINYTMAYVHAQRSCRKTDSNNEIEKKTLLDITHKVKNCIKLFREISFDEKKAVVPHMRKIAQDFNAILAGAEGEEKQKIFEAFEATVSYMRFMAPKVIIAPEAPPDRPKKSKTPPDQLCKNAVAASVLNKVKVFFNVSGQGGHFTAKNFIENALDAVVANKALNLNACVINKELVIAALINEANASFAPARRKASEVFLEEEMSEVAREYRQQLATPTSEYSYKNFDQNLLGACVEAYEKSLKDPDISWKECELVHYPIGNSPQDFETFKQALRDAIEKESDIAQNILSWERWSNDLQPTQLPQNHYLPKERS